MLWFLKECTPGHCLAHNQEAIVDPHTKPSYVPDPHTFLRVVDSMSAIPFESNPHSIFLFFSLENFIAGVHDTVAANWVMDGHKSVRYINLFHVAIPLMTLELVD